MRVVALHYKCCLGSLGCGKIGHHLPGPNEYYNDLFLDNWRLQIEQAIATLQEKLLFSAPCGFIGPIGQTCSVGRKFKGSIEARSVTHSHKVDTFDFVHFVRINIFWVTESEVKFLFLACSAPIVYDIMPTADKSMQITPFTPVFWPPATKVLPLIFKNNNACLRRSVSKYYSSSNVHLIVRFPLSITVSPAVGEEEHGSRSNPWGNRSRTQELGIQEQMRFLG